MSKQEILKKYLLTVEESPIQRSEEWYAIKQKTIGGSEIATVLGINPYNKPKDLIAEKIGLVSFGGNTYTRWGSLFEPVTKIWGEIILKMEEHIEEVGSIKGVIDRQRYSPDGLGVVKLKCEDGSDEYYIVLFEFKAPFSTFPNGSIPAHYIPQVQTGLLNIPITDLAIFINNSYRKCALSELSFNCEYDEVFHKSDFSKRKTGLKKNAVLACGVIGIYQTAENYIELMKYLGYYDDENEDNSKDLPDFEPIRQFDSYYSDLDVDILINTPDDPIDLGEASKQIMDRVLELYDNKRVHAIYFPVIVNDEAVNELDIVANHELYRNKRKHNIKKLGQSYVQKLKDKCARNDWYPVGYLPWKLFVSDIIIEERDETWYDKIKEPVEDVLAVLDDILGHSDPHMRYEELFSNLNESESYMSDMANTGDIISVEKNIDI